MTRTDATPSGRTVRSAPEAGRLPHADRRDALLDVAASLLAGGDVEAVSMEAVAERAGVSRPLVYKHFANRLDLIGALYQRESDRLNADLASAVQAAGSLEDMFRALVHGAISAHATRGTTFIALRAAGARDRLMREKQRRRDRATVDFFAQLASRRFKIDERRARAAMSILLGAIEPIVGQWRLRPTSERAALLADTYVELAIGGLASMTTDD